MFYGLVVFLGLKFFHAAIVMQPVGMAMLLTDGRLLGFLAFLFAKEFIEPKPCRLGVGCEHEQRYQRHGGRADPSPARGNKDLCQQQQHRRAEWPAVLFAGNFLLHRASILRLGQWRESIFVQCSHRLGASQRQVKAASGSGNLTQQVFI